MESNIEIKFIPRRQPTLARRLQRATPISWARTLHCTRGQRHQGCNPDDTRNSLRALGSRLHFHQPSPRPLHLPSYCLPRLQTKPPPQPSHPTPSMERSPNAFATKDYPVVASLGPCNSGETYKYTYIQLYSASRDPVQRWMHARGSEQSWERRGRWRRREVRKRREVGGEVY